MRRTAIGIGTFVLATVLAACGTHAASPPTGGTTTGRSPHPGGAAELAALTKRAPCTPPAHARRADRARIAAFHAVAAVLCTDRERTYPKDGEWTVEVRRATRDVAPLLRALQRPDQPRTSGLCTSDDVGRPPVALVDAQGDVLFPRFPLDECLKPQYAARTALQDLPWKALSTRRVRQQFTEAELRSHCSPDFKNVVALDARFGAPSNSGGPVLSGEPHARLHVCIFRTPAAATEVGHFVREVTLTAAESARLRQALSGPGPGRPCAPQHEFAVVTTRSGRYLSVELGGCWRVDDSEPPPGLGSADAAVVRALLG